MEILNPHIIASERSDPPPSQHSSAGSGQLASLCFCLSPLLCFPHSDFLVCWPSSACVNQDANFRPLLRKVIYLPPAFHKFIGKEVFEGQVKGRDDSHLCGLLPCCFPHPPLVSVLALLPLVSKSAFIFPFFSPRKQPCPAPFL